MREELQRYLDGELEAAELPAELRATARSWDALLEEVRETGPRAAPASLRWRVMEEVVRDEVPARQPWWKRTAAWWVRPRPVRVSPLAALAGAAALALLIVTAPWGSPSATRGDGAPERVRQAVYVHFQLEAPTASSVALAGDFNGWAPNIALQDPDGDGTWSALVPVPPGVHEYMFVIDGSIWVTDPYAERYANDGFGNRNAVLAIAPPAGSGT